MKSNIVQSFGTFGSLGHLVVVFIVIINHAYENVVRTDNRIIDFGPLISNILDPS